jgi:hypothetical protein
VEELDGYRFAGDLARSGLAATSKPPGGERYEGDQADGPGEILDLRRRRAAPPCVDAVMPSPILG